MGHNNRLPDSVYQNQDFLESLARTKSTSKRRKLLKMATTEQLYLLCEMCFNYRTEDIRLTTRQFKRLEPYADLVRCITRIKTTNGLRKFFVRYGADIPADFFAALLTPVLVEIRKSIKDDSESETGSE